MLGPAGELLAQHRVLSCHAHRAGVEVALAHHDAALGHQRRGGEAELVRAQQRADDDVAAGLHLAVSLHADASAQAVQHQGLLCLSQAQLPRRAAVLDGRPGRGAGATVVAGDDDMVGLALGHAGGHSAHAHFRHQLDRHVRLRVDVLQVVDELGQVFDGVDVVVRRRADQAHTRHRVAQEADVLAHLAAGQLAALTRLGALGHLDLDLVRADQVFGRHAKAARGDLLDLGAQAVAVLQFVVGLHDLVAEHVPDLAAADDLDALELVAVAGRVLTALARVALATDAVHRDGERGVGLGGDGAQRHRTGGESLHDFARRLDLVQRHGLAGVELELEQAAQRHVALALVVDDLGVVLVGLELAAARAVLQLGDGVRRPHVFLAAHAPGVLAAGFEHVFEEGVVAEGRLVHADGFFGHLEHADAAHLRGRAAEVLLDKVRLQADGLEDLRAAVGHIGRDAHLGHDLRQALAHGLDVVVARLLRRQLGRQLVLHRFQRFERQVGVNGFGAITGQHGEVVHLARGARLDDQAGRRAQPLAHQVVVHRGQGQQRWDRDAVLAHVAVRDDQDVVAGLDRVHGGGAQRSQLRLDTFAPPGARVGDVQLLGLELAVRGPLDATQPRHVVEVEDGLADLQPHRRVDRVDVQQVGLGADEAVQRHHDVFADRVDRRVRDLREQLLEVVVERLVLAGEHRQGRVVAHRADAFLAIGGHRGEQELDVLLRRAKGLLAVQQRRVERRTNALRNGDIVELDADVFDPLAVGSRVGELVLQFLVIDDAALLQVDQEHLAGLQAPLLDDLALGDGQHA
mmetsp:Transcript_20954/g.80705  ORF Transcript_20954/g.80705 Transcript_20954/m.80705 type:complete len:801 (-) Transcript_20954:283-2685(-)